ncbi:MAG: redoxin domain-containing protein [Chloroflexi bacterium]|nr:redoxin domain-containing protein [Chloroflexota bacterium]
MNLRAVSIIPFIVMLFFSTACASPSEADSHPSPASEGLVITVETSEKAVTPTSVVQKEPSASLAPVFSVTTVAGENIRLEDLLGSVPIYLLFIPSSTDELDISQMRDVQVKINEFENLGAEVVVIVSDLPNQVIDMRDEFGLDFSLIADPLNVVANDWRVFDLDNNGQPNPASFIFNAHGSLIARLVAAEPSDRPSVDEVLSIIEESLSTGAA